MFRTPISLTPQTQLFSLQQRFMALGSCFAHFMGDRMRQNKFDIMVNPLGVLYHPLAIFKVLEMAHYGNMPPEESYLCNQGIHYNYYFHGDLAHTTKDGLQKLIRQQLEATGERIRDSDCLILTFGTAYQYLLKEPSLEVANCHKMPQKYFNKHLSSVNELVEGFAQCRQALGIPRILISVSPVRHIKEGLENNSLSKSILRVACEEITIRLPNTCYFPGYEIILDDLRDYRFFGRDLVHPNDIAQDYIWDLFVKNFIDEPTAAFIVKWEKITRNLQHRPFHPQTPSYQDFLQNTLSLLEQLPTYVNIDQEIELIKSRMT